MIQTSMNLVLVACAAYAICVVICLHLLYSPLSWSYPTPLHSHSHSICLYQQPSKGLVVVRDKDKRGYTYHRERPPRTESGTVDCLVLHTGSCSVAESHGNSYAPVGARDMMMMIHLNTPQPINMMIQSRWTCRLCITVKDGFGYWYR